METIYLPDNFHPVIKLERLANSDAELDDTKSAIERTKVGEIFQTTRDHLTFVCTHCLAEFSLFIQFTSHIEQHLQTIFAAKVEPATDTSSTYLAGDSCGDTDIKPMILVETETQLDGHWDETGSYASDNSPEADEAADDGIDSKNAIPTSEDPKPNSSMDCPKCSRKFKNLAGLNVHLTRGHSNEQYKCSSCNKIHWSLITFKVHVKNCSGANEYESPALKYEGEQLKSAEREAAIKSHDSASYECFQCHRTFATKIECQTHVTNHLAIETNCVHCRQTITTSASLQRHRRHCKLKAAHSTPTECFVCKQVFPSRGRYLIHAHEDHHLNESQIRMGRKSKCNQCALEFHSRTEYEKHRQLHSAQRSRKQQVCEVCGKIYKSLHCYRIHVRTHAGEALFYCDICDKTYPNSYKYDHSLKHTEKRIQCSECGLMFANNFRLKRHMRTHTGEKPYECEFCFIKYRTKCLLDGHRRSHTGDFIYYCTPCQKGYTCKKGLQKHNFKVHGLPKKNNDGK